MVNKYKYNINGKLNIINEKYRINSIYNVGFSMSGLMNTIKPKTEEELFNIITEKLILRLGKELFEACKKEGYETTIEECNDWQYTLYVIHTFRGFKMEMEAEELLRKEGVTTRGVTPEEDIMYAIDIVAKYKDKRYAIQVKPQSYLYTREDIKKMNKDKNKLFMDKYNCKVIYLYYDKNGFTNINNIYDLLGIEFEY